MDFDGSFGHLALDILSPLLRDGLWSEDTIESVEDDLIEVLDEDSSGERVPDRPPTPVAPPAAAIARAEGPCALRVSRGGATAFRPRTASRKLRACRTRSRGRTVMCIKIGGEPWCAEGASSTLGVGGFEFSFSPSARVNEMEPK